MPTEAELRKLLMEEYKIISEQIIHWDTFFWTKATFFLAVEGVAILGTVDRLSTATDGDSALDLRKFWLLLGMVLLNWFLSYVWYLTGRRNRVFLNVRFKRSKQIEMHELLYCGRLIRLYQEQDDALNHVKLRGKSSHYWEIAIPVVFVIAWAFLLALGVSMLKVTCPLFPPTALPKFA